MFKKYRGKLFCFSPPVMLATFLIEFSLAIYTALRYKTSKIYKLVFAALLALGIFQLSEYMMCGGLGLSNVNWARIGYISITLLPALGIHIITTLANEKKPILVAISYISCLAFVIMYLLISNSVTHKLCYTNYAIFSTYNDINIPFAIYYYGWLIIGVYLAFKWAKSLPQKRKALKAMALGYLAFILPTTFFNLVDPRTIDGIPSIMCGLAVLFAITLVFIVLPNSVDKKITKKLRDNI